MATPESCDGTDEDCDEIVDEDAEAACVVANGIGRCEASECVIDACDPTHGDCDGLYETGCEVETETSVTHCGVCDHACAGRDVCRDGLCDSERVVDVTAGEVHSCALRATGEVLCWGVNDRGQLGTGDLLDRLVPAPVVGPTDFVDIEAGGRFTCGIRAAGTVACWGSNYRGEIGDGTTVAARLTPTDTLPIGAPVVELAPSPWGNEFVLARTSDGDVWAWGNNYYGQLGEATRPTEALTPFSLGVTSAIDVDAASTYSCVVTAADHADCLGITPADIASFRASRVWAGEDHLCFTDLGDALTCLGSNAYGETGPFAAATSPSDVATGLHLTCVVDPAGISECRGLMLPLGWVPAVQRITMGLQRISALDARGRVWSWNSVYLGDGSSAPSGSAAAAYLYSGR
ncbi:MAG: hypothetical protein AB7S26_32890 [Sandaracinaceae bacterium]